MWSLEDLEVPGAAPSWPRSTCRRCGAEHRRHGVFPSDARGVFEAVASADKTLEMIPGAHYFEDSEVNREARWT